MNRRDWEIGNGHRGGIVWFTGLSGSGKTAIAQAAERILAHQGLFCKIIDGDRLREGLNRDLGFTDADRNENVRRAAEVAAMFMESGFIVLVPMITPFSSIRNQLKQRFGPLDFLDVYIRCSLQECERRDPKGLYCRARKGQIKSFTGIDSPYEPPQQPDLTIDTENQEIVVCVDTLVRYIRMRFVDPIPTKEDEE